jgi:hypothetical protein
MPLVLDLPAYSQLDGVYMNSPRYTFDVDEETDDDVGCEIRGYSLRSGRAASQLTNRHLTRSIDTQLALGSVGSTGSPTLVAAAPSVPAIITDISPPFLQMAQRKMEAVGAGRSGKGLPTIDVSLLHGNTMNTPCSMRCP